MPRQNRVDPFGNIITHPSRGLLMGNRGCLHDENGRIIRKTARSAWISCLPTWPGVRRQLMAPGCYTELFFLDEATAIAAGHRPCGSCRSDRLLAFKQAWQRAHALPYLPPVDEIDDVLRAASNTRTRDALPDGAMAAADGKPLLRWRSAWLPWSAEGYGTKVSLGTEPLKVITSEPMLRILAAGYVPGIHPTAN